MCNEKNNGKKPTQGNYSEKNDRAVSGSLVVKKKTSKTFKKNGVGENPSPISMKPGLPGSN
ncbi:hypothetical protein [Clostridium perfringens]|uniref:hypothetical protein n=1 Tax=Clostridium perfringens TaxID=1502 RepID=UPI0013E36430|nr:hypothetical protein [Clostridium perfringens]EIF2086667.1 hypothetical protein [Clostridium perfringens]MDK0830160.1 hypothetical protein [Clostridium perfringens]NGT03819.1 hypothetical protein [Clostridium perfringens]